MNELKQLGDELKARAGAQAALRMQLAEAEGRAAAEEQRAKDLDDAVAVLAALQGEFKAVFEKAVGDVITPGIASIFGEGLSLVVEFGVSNELPVVHFRVRNADGRENEILGEDGGGLANVVCFLLEVLFLLSARPALRRLLVLDEAFANIDGETIEPLVKLLRRISLDGSIQLVLVTHNPLLVEAADLVHTFAKVENRTIVRTQRRNSVAEAGA